MWDRIEADVRKQDIGSAAAKLRRGSEEYFAAASDAFQAQVIYKMNGRWELGDFLPAAMGQYRSLLRQAKKAAQSWGDKDTFDRLQELDSTVGSIFTRSNAEQWAVNANVHYNNWANFQEKDFRPLLEAFQDLFTLFVCSKCGGMLHVVGKGIIPESVRCNCGFVNWNLVDKSKQ